MSHIKVIFFPNENCIGIPWDSHIKVSCETLEETKQKQNNSSKKKKKRKQKQKQKQNKTKTPSDWTFVASSNTKIAISKKKKYRAVKSNATLVYVCGKPLPSCFEFNNEVTYLFKLHNFASADRKH